jgi:hypothetical protein
MRICSPIGVRAPRSKDLLPLAHRGDEDRSHAGRLLLGQRAVEFFQRLAGPEHLLEAVELPAAHALKASDLVDDDRPGPDRGGQIRPSITSLTTRLACMNSDHRVTSWVAAN